MIRKLAMSQNKGFRKLLEFLELYICSNTNQLPVAFNCYVLHKQKTVRYSTTAFPYNIEHTCSFLGNKFRVNFLHNFINALTARKRIPLFPSRCKLMNIWNNCRFITPVFFLKRNQRAPCFFLKLLRNYTFVEVSAQLKTNPWVCEIKYLKASKNNYGMHHTQKIRTLDVLTRRSSS